MPGLQQEETGQVGLSDTYEFAPLMRSPADAIQDRWWIRTSVQQGTTQNGTLTRDPERDRLRP